MTFKFPYNPESNCTSFTVKTTQLPNPHLFIDLMPNYEITNIYDWDID